MPSVAELLEEAERRRLTGWDLSYDGRIEHVAPWDFEAIVGGYLVRSPNLLDMGTGGGEWLSRRPFPKGRTVATEAWWPNVALAQARLAPLGATVVAVVGAPDNVDQAAAPFVPALPFATATFHLITNRHESFVAAEIARVLAPGGAFLTQQVASDLGAPFRALLGAPPVPHAPPWTLPEALRQVGAGGLEVIGCAQGAARLTFADVGALAWYLINVPWVMPDFSISRHRKQLQELHERPAIAVQQPMFRLEARKPR